MKNTDLGMAFRVAEWIQTLLSLELSDGLPAWREWKSNELKNILNGFDSSVLQEGVNIFNTFSIGSSKPSNITINDLLL